MAALILNLFFCIASIGLNSSRAVATKFPIGWYINFTTAFAIKYKKIAIETKLESIHIVGVIVGQKSQDIRNTIKNVVDLSARENLQAALDLTVEQIDTDNVLQYIDISKYCKNRVEIHGFPCCKVGRYTSALKWEAL